MCGEISRICEIQQFFKVASSCVDWHQFTDKKISQWEKIWNVFIFGSYLEIWHLVCGLLYSYCVSQSGQNFVTKVWRVWSRTFILQVNTGNVLLWKHSTHSTTMQIRIISRFWFCSRFGRFEINIRRNSVQFRKQNICANKLDVQETVSHSSTEVASFRSMQVYAWTEFPFSFSGIWWLKNFIPVIGNPSADVEPNMKNSIPIKHTNVILRNIDHIPSIQQILLLVFWCVSWRTKRQATWLSKVEVTQRGMFHEPTELIWICCSTVLYWFYKFKSVTLTPITNSQIFWLKGITVFRCTQNFSLTNCSTMTKRIRNSQKRKEIVVSKSRPAVIIIFSF